jgi:hypothetical protein
VWAAFQGELKSIPHGSLIGREAHYRRDANDGARASAKAQPPPILTPVLARSMLSALINRK